MKRRILMMALCLALITATACKKLDSGNMSSSQEMDSNKTMDETEKTADEMLVYIKSFDGRRLSFDMVEWVGVPSERATELGLSSEDGPNGFHIYNEIATVEERNLSDHCVCHVLDWNDNFVEIEVTPNELMDILNEREAEWIPYVLTIENGEITSVSERYVP